MYRALTARSIPATLILFPDEGQGSVKRANQGMELGSALRFLEENLRR